MQKIWIGCWKGLDFCSGGGDSFHTMEGIDAPGNGCHKAKVSTEIMIYFNWQRIIQIFTSLPGTDATHAEHIETIKSRLYVGVRDDGKFLPGELGMGLVEGWLQKYLFLQD